MSDESDRSSVGDGDDRLVSDDEARESDRSHSDDSRSDDSRSNDELNPDEHGSEDESESDDIASDPGGFLDMEASVESGSDDDGTSSTSTLRGLNHFEEDGEDEVEPFPQFSLLPPELRAMIWERFCPELKNEGSILPLNLISHRNSHSFLGEGATLSLQTLPARTMRAVNHEARDLVEKRFPEMLSLGPERGTIRIPFNPDLDIIQLEYHGEQARITPHLASRHRSFFRAVRMLCVIDLDPETDEDPALDQFAHFTSLTTLYLQADALDGSSPADLAWCCDTDLARTYRSTFDEIPGDEPMYVILEFLIIPLEGEIFPKLEIVLTKTTKRESVYVWPAASKASSYESEAWAAMKKDARAITDAFGSEIGQAVEFLPLFSWEFERAVSQYDKLIASGGDLDAWSASSSDDDTESSDDYDSSGIDDDPINDDSDSDEDDDLALIYGETLSGNDFDTMSSADGDSVLADDAQDLPSDDEGEQGMGDSFPNFSSPEPNSDGDDDDGEIPATNGRKRTRQVISSDEESSSEEEEDAAPSRKRRRAHVDLSDSGDEDENEEPENDAGSSMTLAERLAKLRDENPIPDEDDDIPDSDSEHQDIGDYQLGYEESSGGEESEAGEYFMADVEGDLDEGDGYDEEEAYGDVFNDDNGDGEDEW